MTGHSGGEGRRWRPCHHSGAWSPLRLDVVGYSPHRTPMTDRPDPAGDGFGGVMGPGCAGRPMPRRQPSSPGFDS
jgi:hypothetical protein